MCKSYKGIVYSTIYETISKDFEEKNVQNDNLMLT